MRLTKNRYWVTEPLSGVKQLFDLFNIGTESFVYLAEIFHRIAGMKNGGMIPVAHLHTYL